MRNFLLTIIFMLLSNSAFCQWTHKYFVDDFGDPTKDEYIYQLTTTGKLSNTATTSGSLTAKTIVLFSENESLPIIRFDLFEYGTRPVGKTIGDASYTCSLKLADGSIEEFTLNPSESSFQLSKLNFRDRVQFINILKNESVPIKCLIDIDGEYGHVQYRFTINPVGFSKAYSRIEPKVNDPNQVVDSKNENYTRRDTLNLEKLKQH